MSFRTKIFILKKEEFKSPNWPYIEFFRLYRVFPGD